MYRRYYSYNDMPTLPQNQTHEKPPEKKEECVPTKKQPQNFSFFENGKLLGRFETDDIILLVVIFLLLADECEDKLLLLAIAFIFFNS